MKIASLIATFFVALLFAVSAYAQNVSITNPWVRATVQGQKATGAFMSITSKENAKLVAASTPIAGVVEIHEMKMEKDVMKMSALTNGLDLPAGQIVELKPGGFHIMLMDLKLSLNKESTVPLTLTFQDLTGKKSQQVIQAPVSNQAPTSSSATSPDHGAAHKH